MIAFDAFWELNTERQISMGIGPIPGGSIRSYARDAGLFGTAAESFRVLIRAMDAEYLKRNAPKKNGSRDG